MSNEPRVAVRVVRDAFIVVTVNACSPYFRRVVLFCVCVCVCVRVCVCLFCFVCGRDAIDFPRRGRGLVSVVWKFQYQRKSADRGVRVVSPPMFAARPGSGRTIGLARDKRRSNTKRVRGVRVVSPPMFAAWPGSGRTIAH